MEFASSTLKNYLNEKSTLERINISNFIVVSPNLIAYVIFSLVSNRSSPTFKRILRLFVNLSLGTLFADLIKNIIPETLSALAVQKENNSTKIELFCLSLLATLCFLIFVDKLLKLLKNSASENTKFKSVISVATFLLSDGIHNFMDGIAVASFYKMDYKLGVLSTISIFIHEIPHQLGDFSLLMLKGYSLFQVFFLQSFTSIFTLMGGMFAEKIDDQYLLYLNAIVIVSFIHLIFTHIVPSIVKETDNLFMAFLEIFSIYLGYIQIH